MVYNISEYRDHNVLKVGRLTKRCTCCVDLTGTLLLLFKPGGGLPVGTTKILQKI